MSLEETPRKPGTFTADNRPAAHRPRGAVNKITRDLKSGIIDAAAALGRDGKGDGGLPGYLEYLARKHPKAFAQLLGKLLPLQVTGNVQSGIGVVNIVAIPSAQYVTADQMNSPPLLELESHSGDGDGDGDGAETETERAA